jgi:hypothetical protein
MGAVAILKVTTRSGAMNVLDTSRKILDAVDANFDAQLAATMDFVAIPSTRGRKGGARTWSEISCAGAATRSTTSTLISTP